MTDREQAITGCMNFTIRHAGKGDDRSRRLLEKVKAHRLRKYFGYCFDGEQKGYRGDDLESFAKSRTCGFNIVLWLSLASLFVQAFRLWLEWRKWNPKVEARGC